MVTEHLVVTGKSGTGVSTTAVNLSAALAEQGYRVAHLGYDRRRLSTGLLRGITPLEPACGRADHHACQDAKAHCALGFQGVLCIECGVDDEAERLPEFAQVCRMELIASFKPDFVVHDFAGEPEYVMQFLRNDGEATRLFLVASADFAALTTLNEYLGVMGDETSATQFGGIVANNISGPFFESLVDDFMRQTGTSPLVSIPRSLMISAGEYVNQSVLESAPQSHLSSVYRKLARLVAQGLAPAAPRPFDAAAYMAWLQKWNDITEELEHGLVRDGAAI